jgi:hypothetical protein
MKLQPQERKMFFSNWLKLLAFVNDKYKLVESFNHPESPVGIKPETILKIKTKLWENVKIIDEYIDSVWDLPRSDIQLLKGWKNKIEGTFLIVKHLRNYSVFLDDANDSLYGVIGITDSIAETIPLEALPTMVKTALLPFGDRIIYDSVFSMQNIRFGPNMRKSYYDRYSVIKGRMGIITTLS